MTDLLQAAKEVVRQISMEHLSENAVKSLRQAISKAEQAEQQEPVACPNLQPVINWLENGCDPKEAAKELRIYQERMNTAPQPVKEVELTDDEIEQLENECEVGWNRVFARAVIAAHKEKNRV